MGIGEGGHACQCAPPGALIHEHTYPRKDFAMPTALHRAARRATTRLGVHGCGLLLIAAIWALMGAGVLTGPHLAGDPDVMLVHLYIPAPIRATMWLTAAALCAAYALDRRGPRRDGVAVAVACIPPMLRFASYLWSWIVSIVPGDPDGSPRGWYTASIYACMVGLVWLVAAIPDDGPTRVTDLTIKEYGHREEPPPHDDPDDEPA